MARIRDAEKTRHAIVMAARQEFLEKGYAGARMESIARTAGVKKELIYHYFEGKEAIFNEVRQQQNVDALAASRTDDHMLSVTDPLAQPDMLFVWRFQRALDNPEWVRFVTWEAAQGQETGIPGEEKRRGTIARSVGAIRSAQRDGRLADGLDPKLLQLAVFALANYPLAYAQITRLATGRSPTDPRFRKDWEAFLTELGRRVLRVETKPAPARKAVRRKKAETVAAATSEAPPRRAARKTATPTARLKKTP